MRLYHTSDREIRIPDIHHGRKNADFGWGFYLTPDREFTRRWAGGHAVVNVYDFDTHALTVRRFTRDADWFQYIMHNRRLQDGSDADVIMGPIANDTIFDTLGILGSGLLKPEVALQLLMLGPAYSQVAIKTEKAAAQLRWIGAERIERLSGEALKAEQEAYLESFSRELERLSSMTETDP